MPCKDHVYETHRNLAGDSVWCYFSGWGKERNSNDKIVSSGIGICEIRTKVNGTMVQWWCWPRICVTAADDRRGTETGRGKAPYHWSQQTNGLPKCERTILHGPQWLKNRKCHPSIKNNPRSTPQKTPKQTIRKQPQNTLLHILTMTVNL